MATSEDCLVLVTGASGFVATHIVQQLLQTGYRVRGTVRSLKNDQKVKPLYELCPESNDRLELVECDLLDEQCWPAAVKDCTYVLHTASPVPLVSPAHEDEVIKPAEGTLNVLNASQQSGTVKRVVLTSSVAAIAFNFNPENKIFNEDDWTDTSHPTAGAYIKSKTLAERAAWNFINNTDEERKIELTVINPSLVLGPILCGSDSTSMEIIKQLLNRKMLLLPNFGFGICDVRDVARAHIMAMTLSEATGRRYIVDSDFRWLRDIAHIMDKEFRPQGYKILKTKAPKLLLESSMQRLGEWYIL